MESKEIIEGLGKRTGIDFRKHELIIRNDSMTVVHWLKIPGSSMDNIRFINTNGILAVTGDYGNWIFCREFHPSPEGRTDGHYWGEKLQIASTQKYKEYSPDKTAERIRQELCEADLSQEEIGYLNECLKKVDDKFEYELFAFREGVGRYVDCEGVPFRSEFKPWFAAILDGFDEVCHRLKINSTNPIKDNTNE